MSESDSTAIPYVCIDHNITRRKNAHNDFTRQPFRWAFKQSDICCCSCTTPGLYRFDTRIIYALIYGVFIHFPTHLHHLPQSHTHSHEAHKHSTDYYKSIFLNSSMHWMKQKPTNKKWRKCGVFFFFLFPRLKRAYGRALYKAITNVSYR